MNNGPRANVFPAGEANFGQAMYRSLERATQDTRDGFDFYSVQASFAWPRVDVAGLLRRGVSRPFWMGVCKTRTGYLRIEKCGLKKNADNKKSKKKKKRNADGQKKN